MTFNEFPSSATPLTLESVKAKFTHWRATRVKGNRFPKPLWEDVKHLTKLYDYKQIASELKLNPNRLRLKIEKALSKGSSFPSKSNFIEFPLPPLSPHVEGTLEFTRPDGTILKASGLNHKDLCSLIKGFLGS
jgi:hypothetical protein